MIVLTLFMLLMNVDGRGWWADFDTLPIAQVRVMESLNLYEEADVESNLVGRGRWGDVFLIYEQDGDWLQTDQGWFLQGDLALEPAVVQYSVTLTDSLSLTLGDQNLTLTEKDEVGVTALFEGQALVYSRSGAGWVDLAALDLIPPTADLLDFVEQQAYVQTLATSLYDEPKTTSFLLGELPLGESVTLLTQTDDWVLVRAGTRYGWARAADFDRLPMAQARGVLNAGPVNVRTTPTMGAVVVTVLDYQAEILLLGRNSSSDWLYIRVQGEADGLEGWVSAPFVDLDIDLNDLPIFSSE